MKRLLWILPLMLVFFFCQQKQNSVQLEPGTPAYELADSCATIWSFVDPDSNNVIASTKHFDLTTGEFFSIMRSSMGNQATRFYTLNESTMKRVISTNTEKIVEKKLLMQSAKKKGIKVSDAEVDSMIQMQYERAGGQEAFEKFLDENAVPHEFFLSEIRDQTIIQAYWEKIMSEELPVSEEQVQAAYQTYLRDTLVTVQHVLLMTRGKSDAEKTGIKKQMASILKEAKGGTDFAVLASKYSEDPGSKDKGGYYNDFRRGTMVKPFEKAAFTVPIGGISGIVETRYGYHILKVIERGPKTGELEDIRPQLEKEIRSSSGGNIQKDHVQALMDDAEFELKI